LTELRAESYVVPAADLGPENPLPVFRNPVQDTVIDFDAQNVPEEDRPGMGWQTGMRVLPYRMQDGYNRVRRPREFHSIVLENEFLSVRLLPEVGGLVTSIVYKPLQRELLESNPVFQPANLALRNAWVSGGIEWNTPQLGHHYLTCSPLHAARVTGPGGEPGLRLYAWDRVKCFPYQIDLHLPTGSRFLYARVRLINPHSREIPMYWWTNIGVPEREGGRVLCPADTAFKGVTVVPAPVVTGVDYSYATRVPAACDLFFRIPSGNRPWVAAVEADGVGLIHASTARLKGRKMFVWGMARGGRRWQEYLSVPGRAMKEIQAGLARTQTHSLPMPGKTEWTWTEAFGCLRCDPAKALSEDWQEAYGEAGRILDAELPQAELDRIDAGLSETTRRPPDELLFRGLGWGALERRRAAARGAPSGIPAELPFDDADLGAEQTPWLSLLETGALPAPCPQDDPGHYMIQDEWRTLLEHSLTKDKGDHWAAWLHLGVMRLEAGDTDGARQAWRRSLEQARNGWALRNLSAVEAQAGAADRACDLLREAWETGPKLVALAVEYARSLLEQERFAELRAFIDSLPEHAKAQDRILLFAARAALQDNDFEAVERILDREFDTIREGEVSLSDVWFAMQERKIAIVENVPVDDELRRRVRREFPPPARIDFRVWVDEADKYVAPQHEEQ